MADQKWYDEGLRPKILINWQTFLDHGIPSGWKGPFTNAVINAYTRWMNIAGVDLRFQFWNYTNKTSSGNGELVIKMNEKHFDSNRIASTFGSYNRLEIVFHRKRGSDLTPWNFVPFNANAGEVDMQAVAIHELGHCLGLDHTAASPTVMGGYSYFTRFGPFKSDVADVRNVYSTFTRNRLRQLRTTNGGASWTEVQNNITDLGGHGARTNLNPGVAATPRSGLYVVGWSRPSRAPSWLRGDGDRTLLRHWLFYGGERSVYGPVYASDNSQTMLWAWVDDDDHGTIKIARSDIHGFQWSWAGNPANARTYGTPGLCWTRVNGQSTWILVWTNHDRSSHAATGYVHASISTNNGASWSPPVVLNSFYKTLSGVSAAADSANKAVVAFSWAPHGVGGMNRIRAFNCEVNAGTLKRVSTVYSNETTRIQPALAFDAKAGKFIMAWRGQNAPTSLSSASKSADATSWSGKVSMDSRSSHVAPALAYSPEFRETVMWYAYE